MRNVRRSVGIGQRWFRTGKGAGTRQARAARTRKGQLSLQVGCLVSGVADQASPLVGPPASRSRVFAQPQMDSTRLHDPRAGVSRYVWVGALWCESVHGDGDTLVTPEALLLPCLDEESVWGEPMRRASPDCSSDARRAVGQGAPAGHLFAVLADQCRSWLAFPAVGATPYGACASAAARKCSCARGVCTASPRGIAPQAYEMTCPSAMMARDKGDGGTRKPV